MIYCVHELNFSIFFRCRQKLTASALCGKHILGELHHNHWSGFQDTDDEHRWAKSQVANLGYCWSRALQDNHVNVSNLATLVICS